MRHIICLIFFLPFIVSAQHQSAKVAIQLDHQNIAYMGIPNPITVAATLTPASSLLLTTDNGKITGEAGYYVLYPDHVGTAEVRVLKKTKTVTKAIGGMVLRVRHIPISAHMYGEKNGTISREKICVAIAPMPSADEEHDDVSRIDSFKVLAIRDNTVIFSKCLHEPRGTRFDEETKSFFKTVRVGDKLFITDISCLGPYGMRRRLRSLDFTIVSDTTNMENNDNR